MMTVKKRKPLMRQLKKHWQLYVFLLIPVIYLILFDYVPMTGVQIAFRKYTAGGGIWGSKWVGLKNFTRFIKNYMFERVVGNTISLSLYSLIASFPIPIVFALLLNAVRNLRYKKLVQTISYAPHFISTTVLVGMLFSLFDARTGMYGALSRMLTGAYPADIFANAGNFHHLYVWSGIWQNTGWNAVIYLAALTAVDPTLHEAAQVDGASRFARVIHIDLPSILPTASILLIMNAGHIMTLGFEKAFLMQNSVNLTHMELISTYVYKMGLVNMDFSYSTAIGLMNSVVNLALLVIVNYTTRSLSGSSLF